MSIPHPPLHLLHLLLPKWTNGRLSRMPQLWQIGWPDRRVLTGPLTGCVHTDQISARMKHSNLNLDRRLFDISHLRGKSNFSLHYVYLSYRFTTSSSNLSWNHESFNQWARWRVCCFFFKSFKCICTKQTWWHHFGTKQPIDQRQWEKSTRRADCWTEDDSHLETSHFTGVLDLLLVILNCNKLLQIIFDFERSERSLHTEQLEVVPLFGTSCWYSE